MSQPFDVGQLRHVFLEECEEGLDSIAQSLIALEADPTHRDARHSIFRVAHTVKGGASIVGFTRVAEYAHLFEDALEPLRSSTAPVSSRQITLLLRATDALRGMLAAESLRRDLDLHRREPDTEGAHLVLLPIGPALESLVRAVSEAVAR